MVKFQLIKFKDHFHENDEWIDPKKYKPKPLLLEYCGWVTKETDSIVVLSQGHTVEDSAEDIEYDSHIHILKNCIIKRKNIKIS